MKKGKDGEAQYKQKKKKELKPAKSQSKKSEVLEKMMEKARNQPSA